ncbi:Endonuclease/exonuclease/phosphatase [Desulforamulus reducens MI-1]|uniref:Endonuclease/exonuclease/phosphatase n=1 Tax=Desulforamulus reducens (strain ATCC BAA-1160 / DSM 100696 / MI-1) TaxID=349161 RepID=A4J8A0_DESRM|nr:endonuclease/exonuclease/phosphatase family protein [Desulforamulus reducens]ABO51303.1 Endonuclease/exonuclease/phosphatase [Desulforamulus reducens MI-1]
MSQIKVVSYNIRHAQGMDGTIHIQRIAASLAHTKAQLIGLQEVDKHMPRSHFIHQAKTLGQLLNMHWVYGPNLDWGVAQYGNAILSYWPVLLYRQYMLPSKGEQRGLLEAVLQLKHSKVSFFCTHLGLNQEERAAQVKEILNIIKKCCYPCILVGDFNDGPTSKEHRLLTTILKDAVGIQGSIKTFPSHKPQEQIDYIFVSPEWKILSASTYTTLASDHLPVQITLVLTLEDEEVYKNIHLTKK